MTLIDPESTPLDGQVDPNAEQDPEQGQVEQPPEPGQGADPTSTGGATFASQEEATRAFNELRSKYNARDNEIHDLREQARQQPTQQQQQPEPEDPAVVAQREQHERMGSYYWGRVEQLKEDGYDEEVAKGRAWQDAQNIDAAIQAGIRQGVEKALAPINHIIQSEVVPNTVAREIAQIVPDVPANDVLAVIMDAFPGVTAAQLSNLPKQTREGMYRLATGGAKARAGQQQTKAQPKEAPETLGAPRRAAGERQTYSNGESALIKQYRQIDPDCATDADVMRRYGARIKAGQKP